MYDDLLLPRAGIEASRGKLSGQTRFDDMIERLYQTAQAVCQVINDYQPDLIVALAHGVWGVLWAVEAYWASCKTEQPFPPVMVTNLGREKMERYERVRENLPCARISPFVADYAGMEGRGLDRRDLEQYIGPSNGVSEVLSLRHPVILAMINRNPPQTSRI